MENDQFVTTTYSVEEALTRLRQGIADAGLVLVHEIDSQAILRRHGLAIPPVRQLLFFLPAAMNALVTTAPAAVLDAPLKLVIQSTDLLTTTVFWRDPTTTIGSYPGLGEVAAELQRKLFSVLASVGYEPVVQ